MYNKFKIKSIVPSFMMAAVAVLFMGSCTVYKYVDAPSEDGIYSSSREYRGQADNYSESNNYYRQYFQSKQGSYAEILGEEEESAIFTDIEAYNTREYTGDDGYVYSENVSQEEQYGGWGNNATTVSINLYGGHGGYGGYYDPFYYNSFYGNWGNPYGYGYYPRWRSGFSWWNGWNGFYSPFYHSSHYYGNNYRPYRPYYDNVAYNRGRRNSNYSSRAANGRTSRSTTARGRNAASTQGRRNANTSTSRRGSNTINNSARRNSSVNNSARRSEGNNVRRENNNVRRKATTPASRRVTFPQQSRKNNRVQPTRRQAPVNTRRTQQPTRKQTPTNTRRTQQPRKQPSTRSSTPRRSSSPSTRSAPTRSSSPASRGGGRSGGGRSSGGRR